MERPVARPRTADSDDDQCGQRVARDVAAGLATRGEPDHSKPDRRDQQADPLPSSEVKAEVAFGEHGEEDQSARQHGLHDRQRRQRERADVKPPGANRNDPTQREPLGAEEVGGASQGVPTAYRWRQDRAPLFEQERDVRRERAGQGEGESDGHGGSFSLSWPHAGASGPRAVDIAEGTPTAT